MENRLKLLIIHHSGAIGGAGVSLLHMLKAIENFDIEITVYCPSDPINMMNEIRKFEFKVVSFCNKIPIFEHYSGLSRSIFDIRTVRNVLAIFKFKNKIRELIETVNPDTVIVNSMTLGYVGKIAKLLNKKVVCFHRESYIKGLIGFRTRLLKFQISNNFDKVVFISQYDYNQTGRMKATSKVITDKVILSDYCKLVEDKNDSDQYCEKVNLLYTGGMSELKGPHVLIKALSKCDIRTNVIFLQFNQEKRMRTFSDCKGFKEKFRYLLGKDYTAKVLSLINKHNLWERVHFYPAVTNVEEYYKICDIVIFPSTSPHQARPIYESGACKKPIIITDSPNIREFVINNQNGLLFKNEDYEGLADLINKLARDPILRQILGENNYLMTKERHDFSSLRVEMADVLDLKINDKA